MTQDQAKFIVIQMCQASPFIKGVLFGRGAWELQFPTNEEQLEEMKKFFEDMAYSMQQIIDCDLTDKKK